MSKLNAKDFLCKSEIPLPPKYYRFQPYRMGLDDIGLDLFRDSGKGRKQAEKPQGSAQRSEVRASASTSVGFSDWLDLSPESIEKSAPLDWLSAPEGRLEPLRNSPPLSELGKAEKPNRNKASHAVNCLGKFHKENGSILDLSNVSKWVFQSAVAELLGSDFRVHFCHRNQIDKEVPPSLWKNKDSTFLHGLQKCGSVWVCPVCSSKLTEARKNELQKASEVHYSRGGKLALLTLTTSHKKGTPLSDLLIRQQRAKEDFCGGLRATREWWKLLPIAGQLKTKEWTTKKGLKKQLQYISQATVSGREMTYSDNAGWHPHYHMLLFVNGSINKQILNDGKRLWMMCCKRHGLTASFSRGLDLKFGISAAEYVAKTGNPSSWGLESEVSKAPRKVGKNWKFESYTPFQLASLAFKGEKRFGDLFREFAYASKGLRQLRWSSGSKEYFGIKDVSDQEILDALDGEAELVFEFSKDQWDLVQRQNARDEILDCTNEIQVHIVLKRLRSEDWLYSRAECF